MLTKSKRLKDSIDKLQHKINLKYKTLIVCIFLGQKIKMIENIARIQKYGHKYDKSSGDLLVGMHRFDAHTYKGKIVR